MTIIATKPLQRTDFNWLGDRYEGKVRDTYSRDGLRILIATDRLSAFDKVIAAVPFKGAILTQMAKYWFDRITGAVPHHLVAVPDPNVMIVSDVKIIPVEVIVRGYLVGTAWRTYAAGGAVSGIELPKGLAEFDKLETPLITPTTKAAIGQHDTPISEYEVVSSGIAKSEVWEQVSGYALQLFKVATEELAQRGLVMVDTKYEFGLLDGKVVLADEIHTLDSSRFWIQATLDERLKEGLPPEMLDKEPIRRWLTAQGFSGEGEIPAISQAQIDDWVEHYIKSFKLITGIEPILDPSLPEARIEANLRDYFDLPKK